MSSRHATCSCGQLRLTVEGAPVRVSICHGLACQRRTGSVFGVQARFDAEQVTTEGASRRYIRVSDDGGKCAFHFCPDCGATVFYTPEASPGIVAVPVGVRRSFLPRADEVGLGGAATFVAPASRRHRTRELIGGEVARLRPRAGVSPESQVIVRSMEIGDVHSHDWARQVIDCTSYAVVVADNNGVIREWNESARALFGYTAAEAVGQPVELIIPQRLRAAHSACFGKAMNSGRGYSRAYESTVPARRRDGITIQIRGNLTVLQNDSGAVSGASLIVRLAEEPGHAEPNT